MAKHGARAAAVWRWVRRAVTFGGTAVKFGGTVGGASLALLQLASTYYEMKLNAAVFERNSVESFIGANRMPLAVRALGEGQRQGIPMRVPVWFNPVSWLPIGRVSLFQERLRDEMSVALREYSYRYDRNEEPRLQISGTELYNCDLHGLVLRGAVITDGLLCDANLEHADLTDARLGGARLSGARLSGAILIGAKLYQADLTPSRLRDLRFELQHRPSDLSAANLSNAFLECADLRGADLSGAILNGVILRAANLTGASLRNVKSWGNIRDIELANIRGVRDAPEGLEDWALKAGAVKVTDEDWEQLRKRHCQERASPDCPAKRSDPQWWAPDSFVGR